jgi:DNA repair exonuclease SbcCD ATPase subunit
MLTEQLRMAQQFTEHLEDQRLKKLETIATDITSLTSIIDGLEREHVQLVAQCEAFEAVRSALKKAVAKQNEYRAVLRDLSGQQKKLIKERKFYEENDTCPECEQPIADDFKDTKYSTLATKEQATTEAITKCETVITKYDDQVSEKNTEVEELRNLQELAASITTSLGIHRNRLSQLQRERMKHANPLESEPAVDVDALEQQQTVLRKEHDDLSRARVTLEAASMILKDNGIKTRVIKHYLPIINKQINHYLTLMDFPVNFTLDEAFTEHVLSSHRQEFSYESFSSGQKKRIDIALLLAWRAVARIKNSAACNLLFLDEVFDSSLDSGGTEEVLKIIQNLERDTNVFVISHKTDQMIDKFSHTLVFELNRGFSQLKT